MHAQARKHKGAACAKTMMQLLLLWLVHIKWLEVN